MKAGREHQVPLSDAACAILAKRLAVRPHRCKHVFCDSKGAPLGDGTVRDLFRKLKIATVHGLRSSFRDWCAESGQDRDVAEHCLAHAVGGQTERAYARSTLLERRRAVMDAWGLYLEKTPHSGSQRR